MERKMKKRNKRSHIMARNYEDFKKSFQDYPDYEKGFYYINQRMGGVKDHHTDVDRQTEEFILDELDRIEKEKNNEKK